MKKLLIALFILIPAVCGIGYYFMFMYVPPLPFESVCDKGNAKYTPLCNNVGMRAHSVANLAGINDTDFGPILGIAWRSKGSTISSRGQERRVSEKNAYYYIVGSDTSDYVFLRQVDQTRPVGPKRSYRGK